MSQQSLQKDFGETFMDQVLDWVKNSLAVNDVFDERDIIQFVSETQIPDNVFTYAELRAWALGNGFVEEE